MKKIAAIFILILASKYSISQTADKSTSQFTVGGLVETTLTVTYSDLAKEKVNRIGNFKITNHLGEFKKEYKNVKGVLLLDLLKNMKIISPSPKLLSEYYFVFKASDGYSVVVSWNELFNTEIGTSFFLVVEADNKSLKEGSEKMLMISTKDFRTGRRHVKGLQSLEVRRI